MVVGLGAMGSSVAMHAALRGAEVVGLDARERGHALGASSGKSRIIRQAYFEDPAYVPLLVRAYEDWHELERSTNVQLLHLVGVLLAGSHASPVLRGALESARRHGLKIEALSARELRARYPTLDVGDDEAGVFEPNAGFVVPEAAVRAFQAVAEGVGARLRFGCEVEGWSADASGVTVRVRSGETLRADALVLALGAWFSQEMAQIGITLRVQRNVQAWFAPATDAYDASRFPAFLVDRAHLPAPLYGFPDVGDGVKAAFHGYGALTSPAEIDRGIDGERDVAPIAAALDAWMPGGAGTFLDAKACMYALTPDEHFVIDRHPAHENVVLCGGFSGHGFKFASVVGEIGADLALKGETRYDISFLRADRF